ncbi:hypothetical protein ACFL11_00755 [Patescibacteria group bacterium]
MTVNTLIQRGLDRVAARAGYAFMLLRDGDQPELEDARQGLELLQLLGRVYETSQKEWEDRTQEERDDHLAVRRCFFVERVPVNAPAWQEWNTAIDIEFREILDALMRLFKVSEAIELTASILEDIGTAIPDDIDSMRQLFAALSTSLDNPR